MGEVAVNLSMTDKQCDLLRRLVNSYIDAAAETRDNLSDLAMAKRIRRRLELAWAAERVAGRRAVTR